LSYQPEIENQENLIKKSGLVIVGMGGSNLAPGLLQIWKPNLNITIWRDYGLPDWTPEKLKDKLIVLSSYSGNTEETIDAFKTARERNLPMAVISTGGKLLSLAIENSVPYIKLPDTGIQPRSALGLSVKAFLKLMGEEGELEKINELAESLKPKDYEKDGKMLAEKVKNHIPVIYASKCNSSLAYGWKIKFNETGKIPAFYNVFPELNHNEMNGFDVKNANKALCNKFYFIFLKDKEDDPRILKRMEVLEKLYEQRGLRIEKLELGEGNVWRKIFSSLVLADWTAYYTALEYGLESEQVSMVEEFKKLIL